MVGDLGKQKVAVMSSCLGDIEYIIEGVLYVFDLFEATPAERFELALWRHSKEPES